MSVHENLVSGGLSLAHTALYRLIKNVAEPFRAVKNYLAQRYVQSIFAGLFALEAKHFETKNVTFDEVSK